MNMPAHRLKSFTVKHGAVLARSVVVVTVFALLGFFTLHTSHAATYAVASEAESGTVSGNATTLSDSSASGGSAVEFGSSSSGSGSSCTPAPGITAGFPTNCTTGVPAGTSLTAYTGSSTISTCQTISGKIMTGNFTVTASNGDSSNLNDPCVIIKDSKINGSINTGSYPNTTLGPVLIEDTEIDAGTDVDPSVISGDNTEVLRADVHGGKANFQCMDGNCKIQDSYLHNPYLSGAYHYDVVGTNGATGFDIEHNTLACNFDYPNSGSGSGGCSADLGLFGDSGTISTITVNDNLFVAASQTSDPGYCFITNADKTGKAYPVGDHIVVTGNVFQKGSNGNCGQYGPVDEWASGNGNVWSGNTWDDGSALNQ